MINLDKKQFKDFFDGIKAGKIRNEKTTIPLREAIKLRKKLSMSNKPNGLKCE
jgi:hypothetical protein